MALCCVYSGFFHPVLWPPVLAAVSDSGGARPGLVGCRAAEEWSLQSVVRGTDPWALRAVTGVSCRRGSPLLIGVRSEHKLSTDHIPILYRTGECEPPPHGSSRSSLTQTNVQARAFTNSCACWKWINASKPPSVHEAVIKKRCYFFK